MRGVCITSPEGRRPDLLIDLAVILLLIAARHPCSRAGTLCLELSTEKFGLREWHGLTRQEFYSNMYSLSDGILLKCRRLCTFGTFRFLQFYFCIPPAHQSATRKEADQHRGRVPDCHLSVCIVASAMVKKSSFTSAYKSERG